MGCASSNPLVQGSKQFAETAKDSVADVVTKGENVLHDVGEATKEGIEHVKEAVGSTVTTAQASLGNVVDKVGSTFTSEKDKLPDMSNDNNPEIIPKEQIAKPIEEFVDAVTEAVSESETVLASEIEQQKERISSKMESTTDAADKLGESVAADAKENLNDVLRLEDVEETTLDNIENNYKDMKRKAEDLVNKLASTPPSEPAEEAKEERPPTLWEAAADAILHQKIPPLLRQRFPFEDEEYDGQLSRHEADPTSDIEENSGRHPHPTGIEKRSFPYEGELFEKESMRPPEIIINSENLSIKSYKSEI